MKKTSAFNIDDNDILLKLHNNAIENLKINDNDFICINSAFSLGNTPELIKTEKNEYEIGFAVTLKYLLSNGINLKKINIKNKMSPIDLYKLLDKSNHDALNSIQEKIYNYLKQYVILFCGNIYAKVLKQDNLISMAFPKIDEIVKNIKDGIIGNCNTTYNKIESILYKIGYKLV